MMYPLKSLQLDSIDFDKELISLLKIEFLNSIHFYDQNSNFKSEFEPEINFCFDLIVSTIPIITTGHSYGLELQNLVYKTFRNGTLYPLSGRQRALYLLLRCCGTWGWARLKRYITNNSWSELDQDDIRFKLWKWCQRFDLFFQSCSYLNFVIFLFNGKYASLLDRVLGISMFYKRSEMSRYISFEYMNRQLVWQVLTEFFTSILPFLQFQKVKRSVLNLLTRTSYDSIPLTHCLICFQQNRPSKNIFIPYKTNCGHLFCYYCVQSAILAEQSYPCPRCNQKITTIERNID